MLDRIIELLERLKPEHYSERSGIFSCLSIGHPDIECDCGADKVIKEVDAMIAEIRAAKNEP